MNESKSNHVDIDTVEEKTEFVYVTFDYFAQQLQDEVKLFGGYSSRRISTTGEET